MMIVVRFAFGVILSHTPFIFCLRDGVEAMDDGLVRKVARRPSLVGGILDEKTPPRKGLAVGFRCGDRHRRGRGKRCHRGGPERRQTGHDERSRKRGFPLCLLGEHHRRHGREREGHGVPPALLPFVLAYRMKARRGLDVQGEGMKRPCTFAIPLPSSWSSSRRCFFCFGLAIVGRDVALGVLVLVRRLAPFLPTHPFFVVHTFRVVAASPSLAPRGVACWWCRIVLDVRSWPFGGSKRKEKGRSRCGGPLRRGNRQGNGTPPILTLSPPSLVVVFLFHSPGGDDVTRFPSYTSLLKTVLWSSSGGEREGTAEVPQEGGKRKTVYQRGTSFLWRRRRDCRTRRTRETIPFHRLQSSSLPWTWRRDRTRDEQRGRRGIGRHVHGRALRRRRPRDRLSFPLWRKTGLLHGCCWQDGGHCRRDGTCTPPFIHLLPFHTYDGR